MMLLDDDLRQLTLKNVDCGTIKRQAVGEGHAHADGRRRAEGAARRSPPSPRCSASPRRTWPEDLNARLRVHGPHRGRQERPRDPRCGEQQGAPPGPAQGRRVPHGGARGRGRRDRRASRRPGWRGEVDVGAMLGFAGVSAQDLAIATRQLATLIAAGIPADRRAQRAGRPDRAAAAEADHGRDQAEGERGLLARRRAQRAPEGLRPRST